MKASFITFEGIDGSGKSTQLRLLADALSSRGIAFVTTCEPGGTALGQKLRAAFLETEETVGSMAELLLFAADRAQHIEYLIKPSIASGKVVLSDRYADATAAYQGAGRGFDKDVIRQVIALATGGLKPDLTLFFDIPVETAIERMALRPETESKSNRMDAESTAFYSRVRDAYLAIAANDPERFKVIDGTRLREEIHADVLNLVLGAIE